MTDALFSISCSWIFHRICVELWHSSYLICWLLPFYSQIQSKSLEMPTNHFYSDYSYNFGVCTIPSVPIHSRDTHQRRITFLTKCGKKFSIENRSERYSKLKFSVHENIEQTWANTKFNAISNKNEMNNLINWNESHLNGVESKGLDRDWIDRSNTIHGPFDSILSLYHVNNWRCRRDQISNVQLIIMEFDEHIHIYKFGHYQFQNNIFAISSKILMRNF